MSVSLLCREIKPGGLRIIFSSCTVVNQISLFGLRSSWWHTDKAPAHLHGHRHQPMLVPLPPDFHHQSVQITVLIDQTQHFADPVTTVQNEHRCWVGSSLLLALGLELQLDDPLLDGRFGL